ncbi:16S rRNA (cytidine(1402)-2'-O)-methyltransferase [Zooshikella ganghwensis]|uniref:Ribosomal RNA small subunit methyltransferase I n=1 Tax=Zooshikella ganghwensis TaxID=202772 RepID=A0A4P9VT71_9GAMM|nr:16S rRNA (cytidine(1402)-2'-O)-methyltransferase [Zooshikella ganghwensis]RDH45432.1 16S rRNA (cytidine(1402)-2'-O)-methyltransferase [Zooshikella ganghwensis]
MASGVLYIVATPIGHLDDFSPRAQRILQQVDLIAAEDTRHSSRLLSHFGITTPMVSYHEHNESQRTEQLLAKLQQGQSIALISDAGTPLISDPGYVVVRNARKAGFQVSPIPGPSAIMSALSVAGLPTDRFWFEGFLPAKASQRKQRINELAQLQATWVVYESTHRIIDCLEDMEQVLQNETQVVIARELTKRFETVLSGSASELLERLQDEPIQQKGEFVVLVEGKVEPAHTENEIPADVLHILQTLQTELPVKQAASLTAKISGLKKNLLYKVALSNKGS